MSNRAELLSCFHEMGQPVKAFSGLLMRNHLFCVAVLGVCGGP